MIEMFSEILNALLFGGLELSAVGAFAAIFFWSTCYSRESLG
jgi:hypothetical protein